MKMGLQRRPLAATLSKRKLASAPNQAEVEDEQYRRHGTGPTHSRVVPTTSAQAKQRAGEGGSRGGGGAAAGIRPAGGRRADGVKRPPPGSWRPARAQAAAVRSSSRA